MVTSSMQVTCPECNAVNQYEIEQMELIDTDLQVTYTCTCGCRFTDTYALVYLGGRTNSIEYDRDNLITTR